MEQDSSHTTPRLHCVWAAIMEAVEKAYSKPKVGLSKEGISLLTSLWNKVVEEGLLQSPSAERKFVALQVFPLFFSRLPGAAAGNLMSDSLKRTIVNHSQSKDRALFSAVKKVMEDVVELCKLDKSKSVIGGRCCRTTKCYAELCYGKAAAGTAVGPCD